MYEHPFMLCINTVWRVIGTMIPVSTMLKIEDCQGIQKKNAFRCELVPLVLRPSCKFSRDIPHYSDSNNKC
jgi:hypothetical protein